jgi:ankyrin repeat protein
MDALDDDGETAVMLAAIEGCSDIVAMLLEAGCSLAGFEEKGWALLGPDKYIGRLDEHCAQMIAAEWERRELRGQVARLDEKSRLGAKSL